MVLGAAALVCMRMPNAVAASGMTPRPVSSGDPVASCNPLAPTGQDDGPSIAVDPWDRRHLVAAWTAMGNTAAQVAWSDDSGRSWHRVLMPALTTCFDGEDDHVDNLWVSTGPDGTTYLIAKVGTAAGAVSTVAATTSTDGGRTWSAPQRIQPYDGLYNDKPTVVADPAHAGQACAVWRKVVGVGVEPAQAIAVSCTGNHGTTWSSPAVAHIAAPGTYEVPNIVALADGTLEDVIVVGNQVSRGGADSVAGTAAEPVEITVSRSTDGGATWSVPSHVAGYNAAVPISGNVQFAPGPLVAATAEGNRVLVAFQDSEDGGGQPTRIALVRSDDGGSSWSPPATVTSGDLPYYPMVAATPTRIAVGYYDSRNDPNHQPTVADVWAKVSTDSGATWTEHHVDGPFLMPQHDPGDYQSAAATKFGFGFAYTRSSLDPSDPSDIWFAAF